MSGGSSKSSSTSNTSYQTVNSTLEGENPISIINSDGVEVYATDHNAIAGALEFAENALGSVESISRDSNSAVKSAYSGASSLLNKQVATIREFAETLKLGDTESKKWLTIVLVVAVALVLIVGFIWR